MSTFFDVVTVACFVGLVIAFFQFTDRGTRTLVEFVLAGVVFAVANQVGNAGSTVLALILIVAGAGFAAVTVGR
jgi:predicted branched-subunit amino acid permease